MKPFLQFVASVGLMVGGCRGDAAEEAVSPGAIVRIVPARVSEPSAWGLFDRSVSTGFTPTRPVGIDLDRRREIVAVKVLGGSPYELEVRARDGALGFPKVDLATLPSGWHVIRPSSLVSTDHVELVFRAHGEGAVPEVELWTTTEPSDAALDPASEPLAPGLESLAAVESSLEIEPSACGTFAVELPRPSAIYRRAHVVYEANVLRPWALERSVNGRAAVGGTWIGGARGARALVDEIDPADLNLGLNKLRFCVPTAATERVHLSKVRIVGELDAGTRLITNAATDQRDASALIDHRATTTFSVTSGERVVLSFERLIAPDALVMDSASAVGDVACIAKDGTERTLATEDLGEALRIEGGAQACRGLALVFRTPANIAELDVVGSGAAERVDWATLVVTSAPEHFGTRAWIGGFVARPRVMTGAIRVAVAERATENKTGAFGQLVERTDGAASWSVDVAARLPDGTQQVRNVLLDADRSADLVATTATASASDADIKRFGTVDTFVASKASLMTELKLQVGTRAGITVPAGAVLRPTDIKARRLGPAALPPLDAGMINVTAPKGQGYEFLPHGQRFAKKVEVTIPYDRKLIPQAMSPSDVHTYFYDEKARRWQKLERKTLDVGEEVLRSSTDHFTIMINAVLALPTSPTPLSLDPTALSSLPAASPAAGMDFITPPTANAMGDARTSLPIRLPAGRGAYTPSLALSYSSASDNGWLGVGWNLQTSAIEIDTRWGVPTYADNEEPRYLLDGVALVPTTDSGEGPTCSGGGTGQRYHPRVEGAFTHIRRCGANPASYYFELRDRDGTRFVYGSPTAANAGNAWLVSTRQRPGGGYGVFRWNLREVVDAHGNTTTYSYQVDEVPGAEPGRNVYPLSIAYTSHPQKPAAYSVLFVLDGVGRPDRAISGRGGFKLVNRHLLRRVVVRFGTDVVREYVLSYAHGEFEKSLLSNVRVYGLGGCTSTGADAFTLPSCTSFLDEHAFDYHHSAVEGFGMVESWDVVNDPDALKGMLGRGRSDATSGGVSIGVKDPSSSVSGSFGVNTYLGTRDESVGFYDVNGDGLADQVYVDPVSGLLRVYYNQSSLFSETGLTLTGLPSLGVESQLGWGVDASIGIGRGPFGASVSGGIGGSTSRASRFLTDLDGDGFIDLFANLASLRGAPCPTGTCFTPLAFGAADHIEPGEDPVLRELDTELGEQTMLGDPVVRWVAPYNGQVRVFGTVGLTSTAGTTDGVTFELFQGSTRLEAWAFDCASTPPCSPIQITPRFVDVQKGESLYIRVATGVDEGIKRSAPGEEVHSNLAFEYTKATDFYHPGNTQLTPGSEVEPTGSPVYVFGHDKELRVGATGPIEISFDGDVHVQGQLMKAVTAADLRACLLLIRRDLELVDYRCNTPSSFGVKVLWSSGVMTDTTATTKTINETFSAEAGDRLLLRVEGDYSYDPRGITFVPPATGPAVSYTAACIRRLPFFPCMQTAAPDELPNLPIDNAAFGVYAAPPAPPAPFGAIPLSWTAPAPAKYVLHPFPNPLGSEEIEFAIRSNFQQTLIVFACATTTCTPPGGQFGFEASAGEWFSFEVRTKNLHLPPVHATVTLTYFTPIPVPLIFHEWDGLPREMPPFAGSYRGFSATIWNERVRFAPTQLLEDYADPSGLTFERRVELASSATMPVPAFVGQPVTSQAPAWMGAASAAFVTETGKFHAAHLGAFASAAPIDPSAGLFARGYGRLSGTQSQFVGLGASGAGFPSVAFSGNLSGTATRSWTKTTTDIFDVNGDGIADVVAGEKTFAGALALPPSPPLLAGLNFGKGFRLRTGRDFSVSMGANASLVVTNAHGRKLWERVIAKVGGAGYSTSLGLSIGRSQTTQDVVDLNGDGLPDIVERAGSDIWVRYNLGTSLGAREAFGTVQPEMRAEIDGFQRFERDLPASSGEDYDSTSNAISHDTTITQHDSKTFSLWVAKYTRSTRTTSSRTTRQLADLDGDGLPDLLFKQSGQPIKVQFNRGSTFGPAKAWATPPWQVGGSNLPLGPTFASEFAAILETGDRTLTGLDVLAGTSSQEATTHTGSLTVPIIPDVVSITADVGRSHDTDTYELALLDVTGDGRPDHVLRRGSTSKTYVKRNQIQSYANLLFNVRHRLGGSFQLLYGETPNTVDSPHRRVVLRSVEVGDNVDLGPAFASPNLVTEVAYENGFFHRNEKEFFGFAKVTTTVLDGGAAYRKTEQTFNNRDYALRGLVQRERLLDAAGHVFSERVITYDVRSVRDAADQPLAAHSDCMNGLHPLLARLGSAACTPVLPVPLQETETRTEGGTLAKTRTTKDLTHDRFNNVLTSTDTGDDAITTDDLFIAAGYANDTARWILGRPSSLEVRAGSAAGTLLRQRTGTYTSQGKPQTIGTATGTGTATSQFTYDAFGNLSTITTPPNSANQSQTYTVTYDPVVSTYAASVTDAFGYTSSSTFDPRFGAVLSETDVNGSQLVRTYDAFGRLATVRGPYDSAGAPALTLSYFPAEATPRATTVIKTAAPPGYTGPIPAPVTNVTFVDGLGAPLEVRKTAVVDGVLGMTTSGFVQRDSLGRALKSYQPFFTAGASTAFAAPQTTFATTTAYDVLDRPTLVTHPDAQTEATAYAIAPSPQGALLFQTQHTIPMSPANRVREQYADHLGHMRAFVEHPQPTTSAATLYDYTPTGELKQIVDAENNKTDLAYDLRGLRTSFSNPDTGTHQDIFDLMGNRITIITPNLAALGAKINFVYDRNQLVTIDYPSKTDVTFVYGPPGAPNYTAGRLLSRSDETGAIDYAYGALGEVRETHRTFDGPGIPTTPAIADVTHAFTYDSLGRQLELKYPDGESVTNTYDAAGMLSEVKGSALYAADIRYDVFGNRTHMAVGKVVTTWTYDPARVRLANVTSTLQTAGQPKIQNLQYTYDPAGNPTSLVNTLPPSTGHMPGASSSTFTYDGVDRLVHIVGTADVDGTTSTTYDQTFAYSPSHNLLAKSRIHTVGATTPPATNFSSTYTYATRPHLPDIIGGLKITYDAAGNPIVRNQNGQDQTLIWDDDDRLVDLTDEATDVTQHNAYDADGLRVLRVTDSPNGSHTTVFASPYFDIEDGTNLKHIFAGGARIATYVDNALYFLHSNHLGSTGVVSDANGTIHQSLEYFADGEIWIDRAPSTPFNGYLFNGKPYDPETGFYDYGQRFYDPRTSLWLGIDPALIDSPDSRPERTTIVAPNAYAGHSPLRFVDPDGRDFEDLQYLSQQTGPQHPYAKWSDRIGSRWTSGTPVISHASPYLAFPVLAIPLGAYSVLESLGRMSQELWNAGGDASKVDPRTSLTLLTFIVGAMTPRLSAGQIGANGGKLSTFNPESGRTNCVQCVIAFLKTTKGRQLETASSEAAENLGLIKNANQHIVQQAGVRLGEAQYSAMDTARQVQYYVVYKGTSKVRADHVMVGVNRNGRRMIYDPQTGERFTDLSKFGPFVSFPVGM